MQGQGMRALLVFCFLGCVTVPKDPLPKDPLEGAPEWVRSGRVARDAGRPDVLYAVGTAPGIKNQSLRRSAAEDRAREEVAMEVVSYLTALTKAFPASTTAGDASEMQQVSSAVKTFSAELLEIKIVDRWVAPDGTEYVLAEANFEEMRRRVVAEATPRKAPPPEESRPPPEAPPPEEPPPPIEAPPPPLPAPPPPGNVTYRRQTVIDFEDDAIEGDLTRPDGAYVEARKRSRLPARTIEIARFPTLEAPDEVVPEQEFTVLVSLTEEQLTPEVEVKQGRTDAEGRLELELPDAAERVEWTLDVVLSAPGFTIVGGSNTARLVLPREGDSTPARFQLAARPASKPREARKLYVTLWYGGAYLAKVARAIAVVQEAVAEREPAPSAAAMPAERSERRKAVALDATPTAAAAVPAAAPLAAGRSHAPLALGLRSPDLTLQLRHRVDPADPEAAEITVVSPHLSPSIRSYAYREPAGLGDFLAHHYARFAVQVPRSVTSKAAAKAPEDSRERTIATIRGFGRQLYDQFAPAPFKEVFWRLRDELGDGFRAIQIVTDDPLLPWELMLPARQGQELDLLGIDFLVARWHTSENGAQLERPPQQIPMSGVVAIAPRYQGGAYLEHQDAELKVLGQLAGFRRTEGRFGALRDLFASLPAGIVHFAGHGVVRKSPGGIAEYSISLEDAELDLLTWRGMAAQRSGAHPLFFFNACEVGQAERVAGFVDGWAPAVLDLGASGYIGGLWPLGDRGAAEFAQSFYDALRTGLRDDGAVEVAEILRPARRRFYQTGDPTDLAYVYYGDPHFQFRR